MFPKRAVSDELDRPAASQHHRLAEQKEAAGDYKAAAAEYEIAARLDPSEENLFDLGSHLLKYHGYLQSLQVFTYAVSKFPRSARLQVGLGIAQYSLGQYRDAVETLCRAVDLDPKDTRALSFLGAMIDVAPELSSEVTKRLAHFAALYPGNPAANYYYAISLWHRGIEGKAKHDARELLKKAVTEDPAFAAAHYQLGLIYQDDGLNYKAAQEFEIAIRLRPNLKSAHYHLAQIYAKEGKTKLAEREFKAVELLNHSHP
jgi:Tfp pilus assembly protein PilF